MIVRRHVLYIPELMQLPDGLVVAVIAGQLAERREVGTEERQGLLAAVVFPFFPEGHVHADMCAGDPRIVPDR